MEDKRAIEIILQNCPLFNGLSLLQIESVLQKYPHQIKSFPEKDFVILQNETCDHLMIVIEGLTQAQMVDNSGKLIVMEELGVNELLAPAFLFSEINKMPVSVFVLKPTGVLYFRRPVLLNMMQENQTILLNFLSMISNRSRFLSQKLKFHAFMTLKNKVAHYLLEEYAGQKSSQIKLTYTQQELADKLGAARTSLARILSELDKDGIIKVRNRNVEILDLKELKNCLE